MSRVFLVIAAIYGALGVSLGAFGAHGLKPILSPERFEIFQTAVSYQMWHALALLGAALFGLQLKVRSSLLSVSGYAFTLGILFFSGSLYLLVLLDKKILGAITPIGGLLMIIGWITLAIAAWRSSRAE